MPPTLQEIIDAALKARGEWERRLEQIRQAYPDAGPLVDSALAWLADHVNQGTLAALPGVVVGELKNLLADGAGPVVRDPVDIT